MTHEEWLEYALRITLENIDKTINGTKAGKSVSNVFRGASLSELRAFRKMIWHALNTSGSKFEWESSDDLFQLRKTQSSTESP